MVLTYQGSNTVSTDALTEQEIEDETKILQIITQMDTAAELLESTIYSAFISLRLL